MILSSHWLNSTSGKRSNLFILLNSANLCFVSLALFCFFFFSEFKWGRQWFVNLDDCAPKGMTLEAQPTASTIQKGGVDKRCVRIVHKIPKELSKTTSAVRADWVRSRLNTNDNESVEYSLYGGMMRKILMLLQRWWIQLGHAPTHIYSYSRSLCKLSGSVAWAIHYPIFLRKWGEDPPWYNVLR